MTRAVLRVLAVANVLAHGAGLLAAAAWLKPGMAPTAEGARFAYLAHAPRGWALGWALWALCALLLVAFLAAATRHVRGRAHLVGLATGLATAGMAVDLACDAVWATVVPAVAARGQHELYLALDRGLTVCGLIVANGLYSLAVLLFALCYGRFAAGLALATFAAGMALAWAGVLGGPPWLPTATGVTIGLYSAWCLAVAFSPAPPGPRIPAPTA